MGLSIFVAILPRELLSPGCVGVGWERHCNTCRKFRELDNQGTVFVLAVDHS